MIHRVPPYFLRGLQLDVIRLGLQSLAVPEFLRHLTNGIVFQFCPWVLDDHQKSVDNIHEACEKIPHFQTSLLHEVQKADEQICPQWKQPLWEGICIPDHRLSVLVLEFCLK